MRKELERDEGLARLGRSTRWLTAGAFMSAGVLSIAAAKTLPGRSTAATPKTPPSTQPATPATTTPAGDDAPVQAPQTQAPQTQAPQTQPPQTQAPQTLAPPTTPPTTAYNPPVVVSGGS